jgi:protein-S-isoprenylcysteine O-methyltransferase Ste14
MNLRHLIIGVSCFWCMSEMILAFAKKSGTAKGSSKDQSSLKLLWLTIGIAVTGGVFLGSKQIGLIKAYGPWLSITGIFLIILGLIIRWIAILTLRKYFTVDVAIQSGQKIIQKGVYKYIRHPCYTGSLLSFLGLGLSLANWLSVLVIFIPVFMAFYYRIRIEEKALTIVFGSEYVNYRKNTRMLIPFVF